jgi:rare lipoprotein A
MKNLLISFVLLSAVCLPAYAQTIKKNIPSTKSKKIPAVQYGIASWYSDKFNGRQTASGEIFSQKKLTCANNKLPMGTWIKVTHLKNNRSIIVRVNDRLNAKNKRLVDLTRLGASKLGLIKKGVARVRVDVLGKVPPRPINNAVK